MPELRADPLRAHPRSVLLAVVEAEASPVVIRRKRVLLEVRVARSWPVLQHFLAERVAPLRELRELRAHLRLLLSRSAVVVAVAGALTMWPPARSSAEMARAAACTVVVGEAVAPERPRPLRGRAARVA